MGTVKIEPALAAELAPIFLRVVSVDQIRVPVVHIMLCACVCLGRGIGVGIGGPHPPNRNHNWKRRGRK